MVKRSLATLVITPTLLAKTFSQSFKDRKTTSWYNQELNISHHNLQLFPQFRLLINTEMFSLQHRTLKFSSWCKSNRNLCNNNRSNNKWWWCSNRTLKCSSNNRPWCNSNSSSNNNNSSSNNSKWCSSSNRPPKTSKLNNYNNRPKMFLRLPKPIKFKPNKKLSSLTKSWRKRKRPR